MFSAELAAAKREALNAFADDRMLIEKYLLQPRHVEIQIFCDQQGNAVYLAERDCSVQRRHQKIIEEAPAPGLSEKLRQAMGLAALRAARAINYLGAGTVEFLLDSSGEFYFMEMNTRLQVEHPVTEMITGLDLVEWQLRIACGEPLPLTQEQIQIKGHAFEARIYAEDPDRQFLPVSGKLSFLQPPSESKYVRVDTGVLQGDDVSVFYDPMIAKLIVWDENRDKALSRFSKALREYRIGGLSTNLEFLYNISTCEPFKNAELCTDFITKNQALIFQAKQQDKPRTIALAALYLRLRQNQQSLQKHLQINDPYSPWNLANAWRLNEAHIQHYSLYHQGEDYAVSIGQAERGNRDYYEIHSQGQSFCAQAKLDNLQMIADIDGHRLQISVANYDDNFTLYTQDAALHFNLPKVDQGEKDSGDQGGLTAPMNGTIVEIHAPPSSQVKKGDALLVMEAMKMEHTIRAPSDGTVMEYYFQAGQLVDGGAELLRFESTSSENIENNPVQ
jgi:3-methylcrotonyl-CoA carboxylase alpha subunit